MKSIFLLRSNFTTGTFSVTIFFIFSQRGTSWQQNCCDKHFLVTKNLSPHTRQDFHNKASHHLVFSHQRVSMKNFFYFKYFQCILTPLSIPNYAQKCSNIHRYLSNIYFINKTNIGVRIPLENFRSNKNFVPRSFLSTKYL